MSDQLVEEAPKTSSKKQVKSNANSVPSQVTDTDKARLQWACRRGMLELDKMLQPFFEECYEHMSLHTKELLLQFLTETDQDLWDWLLGNQLPQDSRYHDLILMIRFYGKKSG